MSRALFVSKRSELINRQSNTSDGSNTSIEEPDGRPTNKHTSDNQRNNFKK